MKWKLPIHWYIWFQWEARRGDHLSTSSATTMSLWEVTACLDNNNDCDTQAHLHAVQKIWPNVHHLQCPVGDFCETLVIITTQICGQWGQKSCLQLKGAGRRRRRKKEAESFQQECVFFFPQLLKRWWRLSPRARINFTLVEKKHLCSLTRGLKIIVCWRQCRQIVFPSWNVSQCV